MQQVPSRRTDLELVPLALTESGDEQLPDARRQQMPHRVHAAIPPVEIANHRHALRIGRPHGKVHAADAAQFGRMGAQPVLDLEQLPFPEQVQLVVSGDAPEAVRIVELDGRASLELHEQPVVDAMLERRDAGHIGFKQAVHVTPGHRDGHRLGVPESNLDCPRPGLSTRIFRWRLSTSRWGPSNRNGSPCCPRTSASKSGLSRIVES